MEENNLANKIKTYLEERFYMGPKGVIGIDIGTSAIKLTEVLKTSDGFKLNRFVSIDLPEGTIIEDEIHKEEELLKCLQDGVTQLGSSFKWVCLGLSGANTILKRLQLPSGTKEEVEDNVFWEIEQYLPFPTDEANISFSIVGENQGGGLDIMVGAAKKSLVLIYKSLVERVGLKVKIVDLTIVGLLNVFEAVESEAIKSGATYLLLDIGAQKTEFIIYKNGVMAFTKEISIGGLTITEEIQRQMGVNFLEAESLKIQGDGNGNIPEEIVEIINQVFDIFFADIRKTIDFWESSSSEEVFEQCYLTGGCSQIPGFSEALEEVVGTQIKLLNPLEKISYSDKNISPEQIDSIVSRGASAIGLGMREVRE